MQKPAALRTSLAKHPQAHAAGRARHVVVAPHVTTVPPPGFDAFRAFLEFEPALVAWMLPSVERLRLREQPQRPVWEIGDIPAFPSPARVGPWKRRMSPISQAESGRCSGTTCIPYTESVPSRARRRSTSCGTLVERPRARAKRSPATGFATTNGPLRRRSARTGPGNSVRASRSRSSSAIRPACAVGSAKRRHTRVGGTSRCSSEKSSTSTPQHLGSRNEHSSSTSGPAARPRRSVSEISGSRSRRAE